MPAGGLWQRWRKTGEQGTRQGRRNFATFPFIVNLTLALSWSGGLHHGIHLWIAGLYPGDKSAARALRQPPAIREKRSLRFCSRRSRAAREGVSGRLRQLLYGKRRRYRLAVRTTPR